MPRLMFAVVLIAASFAASAETPYVVSGYVTAVTSGSEFDLEGVHVRLTPATQFRTRDKIANSTATATRPGSFYVGEAMDAEGKYDRATHSVTASQVTLVPDAPATVSGTAIIDLIPAAPADLPYGERMIRADGYLLHVKSTTKLSFADPLKSISDISTNQWIRYSGVQQLDGTVLLDYAGIGPNGTGKTEQKIRGKTEYDPSAVSDSKRQSGFSKAFIGMNPKRIPAYHDEALQARVQRIGESLIPAYQRALPDSDPSKIHFRFQVVDATKWHDALQMPSGVVIVPHDIVERLQNDSQLATVLADNIAEVLEEDALRALPTARASTAANLAGDAAGIFVPGLGLATSLGTYKVQKHVQNLQLEQSGRVSLDLLHDAGYDIAQAPLAWWTLASKTPKPLEQIPLPPRAATLYMALGTTWHSGAPAANSGAAEKPSGLQQ